jgi:hypothetical protein
VAIWRLYPNFRYNHAFLWHCTFDRLMVENSKLQTWNGRLRNRQICYAHRFVLVSAWKRHGIKMNSTQLCTWVGLPVHTWDNACKTKHMIGPIIGHFSLGSAVVQTPKRSFTHLGNPYDQSIPLKQTPKNRMVLNPKISTSATGKIKHHKTTKCPKKSWSFQWTMVLRTSWAS